MKFKTTILALLASAGLAISVYGQTTITIDFENSTITGGDLVLTETGTGVTDDFESDRFDELSSASFEIQNIASIGTLTVTATALLDDLNVTGSGLQDGSSGYDTAEEGTSFVFNRNVTITSIDFGSFTSAGNDEVILSSGSTTIGTFSEGTISGSTDFSNTNPATMSIAVAAGDAFEIAFSDGDYFVESIGMSVSAIPEPSTYGAIGGILALAMVLYRRRKQAAVRG